MDIPAFEPLAARIVEGSPDAIIFADSDGIVRLWNRGAEETFGFEAREAIGASLDLIIPERLRARHWEGWKRVMETGRTRYGKDTLGVPALRKDGSTVSIEFRIQLVRSDAGAILGPAAILRDVTDRFRREKELRRRIRELEAKLAAIEQGEGGARGR